MRKNKEIKAINTFSVKLEGNNQRVRLDWNGKAETLKDAINVLENVLGAPESTLHEVRLLKPLNLARNRMITMSFSLI